MNGAVSIFGTALFLFPESRRTEPEKTESMNDRGIGLNRRIKGLPVFRITEKLLR